MSRSRREAESKVNDFLQKVYVAFMTIFGLPLALVVVIGPFVMIRTIIEAHRDGVLVPENIQWVIGGYIIAVALIWPMWRTFRGKGPKWLE